jgi:hypothetical protein
LHFIKHEQKKNDALLAFTRIPHGHIIEYVVCRVQVDIDKERMTLFALALRGGRRRTFNSRGGKEYTAMMIHKQQHVSQEMQGSD